MKGSKTKAQAIDLKKDKIVLAGLALLAGLMAVVAFSSNAHASIINSSWAPHVQGENEIKLPFPLKPQKLDH